MSAKRKFKWLRWMVLTAAMAWTASAIAQDDSKREVPKGRSSSVSQSHRDSDGNSIDDPANDSLRELRDQVRELRAAVAEMRSDWQHARAETSELRRELDEMRAGSGSQPVVLKNAVISRTVSQQEGVQGTGSYNQVPEDQTSGNQSSSNQGEQKKNDHAASLEEQYQLLSGKVDDQYQTKVESASKYRVRLSGIVLMNLASTQGTVDSVDLPTLAYARPPGDSGGSFGATLRQSEIGFEAFGPTVAGAKTRADLQLDLAGGFSQTPNGVNSGLVRLRTGTMRMDWATTSVVVGQDAIFFSPNSPTSFATLAQPALSYAGNLWSWVPQIRVEHRVALGDDSSLLFQGGILDPVSGETPSATPYRQPGAGESSRQPALGTRVAWTKNVFGQPLRIGAGGFYSRQDYGFSRTVDGWAGMADLDLPLSHKLFLSGKAYRGRAIGGLYGGLGRSVLFSGDPTIASSEVIGLDSVGGWAQLKYRPANKWEFNAAFGMENSYASDLRYFQYVHAYGDPNLARNQGSFVNFIYRPRSDLLFSAEYRHLTTYTIYGSGNNADHLNLMMGVLF
jgi:TolA-binding protein